MGLDNKLRNTYWNEEKDIFSKIYDQGFSRYFDSIDDSNKCFELKDHSVRCIDEGTPGGIHIAGSGILMDDAHCVSCCAEADVDGVYSHSQCGAAALYAKQKGIEDRDTDEIAIDWAKKLAEKIGAPYLGHIEINEMNRPDGFHSARAIYYDTTGSFNYSQVQGLPRGFIISRSIIGQKDALAELDVAISIAFDGHGFGDKFTEKMPLVLVLIVSEEDGFSGDSLYDEIIPVVDKYSKRIRVEYLVV